MMNFRTDMAVERRDLYKKANNIENEIDGIETEETIDNNMNAKIEMKKNKFNQVKEEKAQEIFDDIIKKVAGIC